MNDRSYLYEHPAEVLTYAGKYKYLEIADEAAPLLLTKPIEEITGVLPPHLVVSWVSIIRVEIIAFPTQRLNRYFTKRSGPKFFEQLIPTLTSNFKATVSAQHGLPG